MTFLTKKLISVVLSISLILCCLPSAFATGENTFVDSFTNLHFQVTGDNTVAVVSDTVPSGAESSYTGEIAIPETVVNSETTYTVTEIGYGAFFQNTAITKVTIPSTVTKIGEKAFYQCRNVTEISLPDGLAEIGALAFNGCSTLATLTIPSAVTSIGGGAFAHCNSLQEITVPAGITDSASIQDLYISDNGAYPGTVKFADGSPFEIDGGVLYNETVAVFCVDREATSITVRAGTTEIFPGAFSKQDSLESVSFADDGQLTNIGQSAFYSCDNLKSVMLPDGLTTIGKGAFEYVPALKFINIPSTVTSLGVNFLSGVSTDTVVVFEGETPPTFESEEDLVWGDTLTALDGIPGDYTKPTVYYPASAAESYTGEGSALLTAGLVTAPSDSGEGEESNEQGYALPKSSTFSGTVGTAIEIGAYTLPTDATLTIEPTEGVSTENGNITYTGTSAGTVTLTAKITKDSVTLAEETYSITMAAATVPATSITLNQNSLFLYSNTTPNTATLTATVEPADSTDTVSWSSSNNDVVTVENGVVKAVGNGTAAITATAGEYSATCEVTVARYSAGGGTVTPTYTVTTPKVDNGSVTVSPKNASKGTTVTITVKPDDGYELDELIVTDKNGDALKLTDKGNGKFTFTMPGSKVEIEASFVEIEEPIVVPEFTDVPADAYYADAVEWAVKNGITIGTGDGTTFSPDLGCTRAQVVTFLWRAAGSPAPKSTVNPFVDVLPGEYYAEAVLWAVENGITVGTNAEGTTFSPDEICSRAQIVTFLWRSENRPAASTSGSFVDVASDTYYTGAVEWAAENAITVGTNPEGTMFSPDEDCTRAQIVTFLYRYMA